MFSQEHSFVTGPPIGRDSTVKFLATADLGHAQTDGSTEIDHAQAHDDLNTTPEGTLQYVSLCLQISLKSMPFLCREFSN